MQEEMRLLRDVREAAGNYLMALRDKEFANLNGGENSLLHDLRERVALYEEFVSDCAQERE